MKPPRAKNKTEAQRSSPTCPGDRSDRHDESDFASDSRPSHPSGAGGRSPAPLPALRVGCAQGGQALSLCAFAKRKLCPPKHRSWLFAPPTGPPRSPLVHSDVLAHLDKSPSRMEWVRFKHPPCTPAKCLGRTESLPRCSPLVCSAPLPTLRPRGASIAHLRASRWARPARGRPGRCANMPPALPLLPFLPSLSIARLCLYVCTRITPRFSGKLDAEVL